MIGVRFVTHVLLAASVSASVDPLAKWLDSLKFALADVTQEKAGITFTASQLVCQNLQLSDIKSAVQDVGLSITLEGVGISCTGHFAYHGLAILSGSGTLTAEVVSSPSSTATVALAGTNFDKNLPWAVEASSCDASIDFTLKLKGSIVYDVVNLFSGPISALIKRQAVSQACAQLKQQAAGQLSQKLSDFNKLMLPNAMHLLGPKADAKEAWLDVHVETFEEADQVPQKRFLQRRLEASPGGTVDWTRDAALEWISWLVDDVIGPKRMDEALRWATKGAEAVSIPGPEKALMTTTVKQPDAGLELKVTAWLKSTSIEGADGMADFSPVQAQGPNDLRFKVSWGTAERPAFGLGVDVKLQVEAVDLASGSSQASMEQEMSLHLAILKPSLEALGEVQVLAREWPGTRSLAQLVVAPKECLTSVLKQAPLLKSLNLQFDNLAAPLSFVTKTQGALENAVANLLNNGVGLFNKVYQPLLPSAIQRFAGSEKMKESVNKVLQDKMKPGKCIDPALASQQVRNVFPQYYGNWPPLLDNFLRQWIDNFFDGFIAHNTSVLEDGLQNMPKVPVPLNGKVTLRQLMATGLDQVSQLRMLLPSAQHPSWLGNKAVAKCPTPEAPWRPSFVVNASVLAGNFGGDGLVSLEMPCGTLDAELDVVVDFWHLMDLQVPPTATCALMSPLAKLDIKRVNATWGGIGRLKVQPKDGPAQYPLAQMCSLHPDACKLADEMREFVSSTEGATRIYHMARDAVLKQCTSPELQGIEDDGFLKDQLGYSYLSPDNYKLWLAGVLTTLALAATYTFCATLGQKLHPDTCERDLSATSNLPLATVCWLGTPASTSVGSLPKMSTFITSSLMAAGLVARVLACFWLPFAAAGVGIEQKTGGTVFKDDALLQYTFFGIGQQFYLGGSLYCQILWFFMSLISAFMCHAILLMVWLTPFLHKSRRKLLMASLVLGRFALSEAETTGNTAMVLSSVVQMPLNMVQKQALSLEAGAYASWFATFCTVLACLMLLKILPRPDAPKEWTRGQAPRYLTILQAISSVAMVAGIGLWYFCDFMKAETGGIAAALIPASSFSGSDLGRTDWSLRILIILTAGLCPLLQIAAFCVGSWGKAPQVARGLAAIASSFCLLDLFAIGFLATFLEGVNGFASSAVHGFAKPVCELTQEALGKDCLTMTASVIPLGTFGLLLATGAWSALVAVQVLGFGQSTARGAVEGPCSQQFQDCRSAQSIEVSAT